VQLGPALGDVAHTAGQRFATPDVNLRRAVDRAAWASSVHSVRDSLGGFKKPSHRETCRDLTRR
jgi:hypothetical protein